MSKKITVLGGLLMAVVMTAYSVSGTYAKYTSTFNGKTSTARVAKWAISVSDLDQTSDPTTAEFEFDLFESVSDANVKTGTDENIIAPGTSGNFEINLANTSEVNAEYTVDYTVVSAGVPLEFSIDGTNWTTDLTDITTAVPINMGATDKINIRWRWAFVGTDSTNFKTAQTDETDTDLGKAGTAQPTVKATIIVNQVD